ncbi:hypothetical protein TrVE_jg4778 [Triparma verrucosa]|uniref:Mitochondrial carrier protein n=1 Tax=Triparma verrucosa TaxID=1606542 RepID=A0A9W7ETN1_9STRA|nr:hypothetical protein TrVE_jg4778 [Triparma verrucosa]
MASKSRTPPTPHLAPHLELLAGTVAGTFGIVPFYPLDTLKSRLQTTSPTTSPFRILKTMLQTEGPTSLYRGCLSPMLGYGLINGSVFLSRSSTRSLLLNGSPRPLKMSEEILVGASSGFWSSFIRCPVERIKSVMQVKTLRNIESPYSSSLECGRILLKEHGVVRGLYKGFGSTVLREVPQYIFYFAAYDNMKRKLGEEKINKDLVPVLAGGVSGVMIWCPPFYSFDVVKTRLQVERFEGTVKYNGFWDCVVKSYKEEGVRVFYRGAGLAQARAFGVHGSIFLIYEKCMEGMGRLEIGAEPRGGTTQIVGEVE